MGGGLLQLAAYGAQDLFLTGNPQMSFFIAVYKRHTNFSLESINQEFIGNNGFGEKVTCNLDRIGDLITQIFVDVKIPSLTDLEIEEQQVVGWVNDLGFSLIEYTEIDIGGTIIDKQYGIWMGIWYELTTPHSKRYAGDILIGKDRLLINDPSNRNNSFHLHIPLQFWFCRHEGLALPLIALQHHEVKINIKFRRLDELWQSTNGKFNQEICTQIAKNKYNIQSASLKVDYIFLENEERKMFVQRKHNYLIEQLQVNTESFQTGQTDIIFNLNLSHPVKELFWIVQNRNNILKNDETSDFKGNEWFNFSDRSLNSATGPGGGSVPKDTIISAELQFEGNPRFERRENIFFRLQQPYQRHTVTPENFAYYYSFALHPERLQPSGTCNFSRIDNVDLMIKLVGDITNGYMKDPQVVLFAVNYNVLQIASGMAGVAYVN